MTRLCEIPRSTQDDNPKNDLCISWFFRHSADSVLPVELQLVTTIGIPNKFQSILVRIGQPRCRLNDQGWQEPRSDRERQWRIPTFLRLATAYCLTPPAWPLGRMLLFTGSPCPSPSTAPEKEQWAIHFYCPDFDTT